ncbi:MAG: lytic transglycosylase [Piscirickettsiaceae bacterium]|nr:MAG: lytic transglycosylase [Piscirickettsiaceae bacterium]
MPHLITNNSIKFFLLINFLFLISCSSSLLRPVEKTRFTEKLVNVQVQHPIIETQETDSQPLPIKNVWQRLFALYKFSNIDNKRIQNELNWYRKHPEYIERVQKNAAPYLFHIVNEIEKRGLPGEFALLPIIESAYRPFAYSPGRAAGLWQFIPSTGKSFGLKQTWWYDGRRDVLASTDAALDYLDSLTARFGGDWFLGLAAYNAGGGNISKAIRRNKKHGKKTDYWSLKLNKETRLYVPKLIAISHILSHAEQYHVDLLAIPNEPYFTKVNTQKQIDLARASELASIDIETLYKLNPAFNQWATDPNGPHYLLLPVDKASRFEQQLSALPDKQRLKWQRHKVKQGETLSHISAHYRTPIKLIEQTNHINNHRIRAGKFLLIPTASYQESLYTNSAPMRKKAIVNAKKSGLKLAYHVKRGDSFWTISRKHHVTVRQLARWNAMAPRDTLRIGQKLTIWQRNQRTSTHDNFKSTFKNQTIRYTVRNGDSLYLISKRFKVSIKDLRRWNSFNNKYLRPGRTLKIIVDVTRS